MHMITLIQKGGQIILPAPIMQMFNLQPGSAVTVSVAGKGIMLEPAKTTHQEEVNEYFEVLDEIAEKNNTTREKLLESHKKIREETFKRYYPQLWKKLNKKSLNGEN